MSVVGIDFGNTNCVIAVAQRGGIDVIMNEVSSRQTPTMAAFGEKERYLGEAASTQYLRNIKNTVVNIKRLIGRKWDEPEVQEELKSCPFKAVELPEKNIGIEVMYQGEKKVFSTQAIAAMILQKMKQITEKATEKGCVDVVISVPGWWTDGQRRAMMDAARIAGLNPLRLINETTATALGYGIYKTNLSDTEPIYVMFVDVGQTTTSVNIVEFLKGKLKVVASAYDRNLGGRNFDQVLVDYFVTEFKTKYNIDIRTNQKAMIRLELACEKLKKTLNINPEAPINVDSIMNDIDVMMKRSDFEQMIQPLMERVLEPIKQVLAAANITPEKLAAIEVCGGGSRLVPLQNKMAEYLKKDVSKTMNAEEAVSRGCALQCAILSPVFKVREFSVTDISLYPVKVSWGKVTGEAMEVDPEDSAELFTKNNAVPSVKMITMNRAEGFQIAAEYADLSLLPPGTHSLIGKYKVPSLPASKHGEAVKVKVKVKLDIHGIISVESAEMVEAIPESEQPKAEGNAQSAEQPEAMQTEQTQETGNKEENKEAKSEEPAKQEEKKRKKVNKTNLTIQSSNGSLPVKELQHHTEEEGRMIAADRLAFETAEAKNAVESYIYDMRSKLNESLAEYSTDQEKETLSKLLETTEDWLYGEGEDVTKSVYVKKWEELKAIGDPIIMRKNEHDNRYEVLVSVRSTIEQFKLQATTEDPKYDHISAEDKAKVLSECEKLSKSLDEELAKQDKLPRSANPVITCAQLQKKQIELQRTCAAIMNKPKPKPKEEPKPTTPQQPEEKKQEEKKQDESSPKTEEKKASEGQEMDLD